MDASATPAGRPASQPGPHRSLNDPVLTSAEEELDVARSDPDASTWASSEVPGGGTAAPWWPQMQDRLGRYVSERPGRAALLALGAGALAAVVLGQGFRGRRRRD